MIITALKKGDKFTISKRKNGKVYTLAQDPVKICEGNGFKNPPIDQIGKVFLQLFDNKGKCCQMIFHCLDRVIQL